MTNPNIRNHKWGLIGAIISAIAASVCCVGPLLLLALGMSGAWVGNLAAFYPYRPIFMIITLVFLGFAFYTVYKKPKDESCEPGSLCANPYANKVNKTVLWIVTIFIFGLLIFPSLAPFLFAGTKTESNIPTQQVTLGVKNMTCAACAVTVKKSLTRLDGIQEVNVTLNPSQATVTFNPDRVSIEKMIEATTNAGYPSSLKGDQ